MAIVENKKILTVNDEPYKKKSIVALLEENGHIV